MSADPCLTDDLLASWAEGTASDDQVSEMTAHVAACVACRSVLSELARTDGSRPAPPTLGRYQLQEQVGRGGMGTVYAAWDPAVGRRVAVKVLHESRPDQAGRVRRFLREREILAGLEHPHIGRLLDAGETAEGRPYLVMEYVQGEPLDVYCDGHRLSTRQRLELLLPVFAAVSHAHRQLVVHRDLKPSNILVSAEGVPKLVDFGIARLLEDPVDLTATGMAPLTPAYASPEQVRREPVATSTDVYSLGVVLHEVLTGVGPYPDAKGEVEALLRAVQQTEPAPPSLAVSRASDEAVATRALSRERLRRELEGDLDAVVGMALRKDPKDRYPSVEALADDVRASLEGRPTSARKGDQLYRAVRFARRHRVLVSALAAAFLALAVGLVATLWEAEVARREGELARRRFEQVRALAHAVLFDYHDGIAALPGSTPLRERLVKDALRYLDSLSAEASDDLALRLELARAYLKVGDVQGDPFGASLGDTTSARASYLKGRALAEAVLATTPADRGARQTLADSHEKLGSILEVTGEQRQALGEYAQAGALARTLALEQPGQLDLQEYVARQDLGQGQVLWYLRELSAAAVKLEQAVATRRELARLEPTPTRRRNVGVALISLARLQADQGHTETAVATAEEAERILAGLVAEQPDSTGFKRAVSVAWAALAGMLRGPRAREGVAWARKGVAQVRQDLAKDPRNAVLERDLIVTLYTLSDSLEAADQPREAWGVLEEALEIQRRLHQEDPGNLQTQQDLCVMLTLQGALGLSTGDLRAAERTYRELLANATALVAANPGSPHPVESSFEARWGLAKVLGRSGRPREALEEAQRAQALVRPILARDPTLKRLENRLAMSLGTEAELLAAMARRAPVPGRRAAWLAAREAHQRALDAFAALEQAGALAEESATDRESTRAGLAHCEQELGAR